MNTMKSMALAAAIACCAAPVLPAQHTEKPAFPDRHISIEFKGGSLAEFLELIRSGNDWVNIVASPEAASVTLPALSIKKAGVLNTLRAVAGIVTSNCSVIVELQGDRGSEPVHSVRVSLKTVRKSSRPDQQEPVMSKVFSLRSLIKDTPGGDKLKSETILMAIDTGLGIDPNSPTAKIKYHADSGLLFIRATPTQIGMVSDVLNELRRDSASSRAGQSARKAQKPKTGNESKDR